MFRVSGSVWGGTVQVMVSLPGVGVLPDMLLDILMFSQACDPTNTDVVMLESLMVKFEPMICIVVPPVTGPVGVPIVGPSRADTESMVGSSMSVWFATEV